MELSMPGFALRLSGSEKQTRRLSDLRDFFADKATADNILKRGDPIIYEVHAKEAGNAGDLSYAVTVINPGDVAGEFYMTKGHFHRKPVGEVYLGLEGEGVLLLQDRAGKTKKLPIRPGEIAYVQKGFAHRAINTGKKQLKFLAVYPSDSGHDYTTIEKKGFKEVMRK